MELRQRVSPQRDADTVVSLDMGIRTVGLSKLLVPRRADVLRFRLWRLVALETDGAAEAAPLQGDEFFPQPVKPG
jgi:hypothetical protein